MGQKTDRIRELETENAAARHLLRSIGDTMGISPAPPTTIADALEWHQRFLESLRSKMIAPIDAGKPASDIPPIPSPRRRIRPVPGSWDTFDEHVDDQIERMEAQGLTKPREDGGGSALVRRDSGDSPFPADGPFATDSTVTSIAQELGLNLDGMALGEALGAIHEEIVRVKNQGADVEAESGSKYLSTGKSLGQAIAHDHAQAAELRDATTQARTIVARLAAVMQIGQWDKDGTELLERAQKWEMWKFDLMKRIRELRAKRPGAVMSIDEGDLAGRIGEELQRQLDRLLTPRELQNWLKSLEKAGAAVKVDAGPPVPPYPFEFRGADVVMVLSGLEHRKASGLVEELGTVAEIGGRRSDAMVEVFRDIAVSRVATEEFTRTMNLVILPILARQRAAQRVREDVSRPTE